MSIEQGSGGFEGMHPEHALAHLGDGALHLLINAGVVVAVGALLLAGLRYITTGGRGGNQQAR
jgi:hypothetical protein